VPRWNLKGISRLIKRSSRFLFQILAWREESGDRSDHGRHADNVPEKASQKAKQEFKR
tara:strand:- start:417 stop:590 length:174 start_codon:yes stop_codon:yes gene_type:complete